MPVLGLTYHDVTAESERRSSGFQGAGADHYKLSPELFAAHLEAIADSRLTPAVGDDDVVHDRSVLLTFDDGGASALTTIAPMLAQRAWPASFFVTTDRIGAPGFLTREGIVELRERGHVVGGHGHTHALLTQLSDAEAREELATSKHILEEILGSRVSSVAIPGGFYSERIGALAAATGYRHVFTSEPWLEPRTVGEARIYGRFAALADTPPVAIARLCRFSRAAVLRQAAGWHGRKAARAVLGPVYPRLREAVLARRAPS